MVKVNYEVTKVWKDRKRASHKTGSMIINYRYADNTSREYAKYLVCDMLNTDDPDMVVILSMEDVIE